MTDLGHSIKMYLEHGISPLNFLKTTPDLTFLFHTVFQLYPKTCFTRFSNRFHHSWPPVDGYFNMKKKIKNSNFLKHYLKWYFLNRSFWHFSTANSRFWGKCKICLENKMFSTSLLCKPKPFWSISKSSFVFEKYDDFIFHTLYQYSFNVNWDWRTNGELIAEDTLEGS